MAARAAKETTESDCIRFKQGDGRSRSPNPSVDMEDVVLSMRRFLPHETTWRNGSDDGSFRVSLPSDVDARELADWAREKGVVFGFGIGLETTTRSRDLTDDGRRDAIYLHYSHLQHAEVEEGLRTIGGLIASYQAALDGRSPSSPTFMNIGGM